MPHTPIYSPNIDLCGGRTCVRVSVYFCNLHAASLLHWTHDSDPEKRKINLWPQQRSNALIRREIFTQYRLHVFRSPCSIGQCVASRSILILWLSLVNRNHMFRIRTQTGKKRKISRIEYYFKYVLSRPLFNWKLYPKIRIDFVQPRHLMSIEQLANFGVENGMRRKWHHDDDAFIELPNKSWNRFCPESYYELLWSSNVRLTFIGLFIPRLWKYGVFAFLFICLEHPKAEKSGTKT